MSKRSKDRNQEVWNSSDVIDFYIKRIGEGIQKPEAAIFEAIGDISDASLLDIGIGTGRTTALLGNKVRNYLGIDYSEKMIDECSKIFSGKNLVLKKGDAREMTDIKDNSFDICLFSFNGIDYITNLSARETVIDEIRRIVKPGGYFIFSTHNLYNLPVRFRLLQFEKGIYYAAKSFFRSLIYRVLRMGFSGKPGNADYLILNDGALRFRLSTFYIKPEYQISQLLSRDFEHIKVFDLNGRQIHKEFERTKENYYLYYLCKKKSI